MNEKVLKAGVAQLDISPPVGIELAGYPHHARANTGILDPLFAICVVLDDGQTKVALVGLDLLFFSKKYVRAVCERAQQCCSLPKDQLMIMCTHTHSGPWAAGRLDKEGLEQKCKPDSAYVNFVMDRIIEGLRTATNGMFDAKIGYASVQCGKQDGIGGNRRRKDGITDPELSVCVIKDADDAIRGIIGNYALHPTILHAENTKVSADYPGAIRNTLKDHGYDAPFLFMQGFSGDQSTRYYRKGQSVDEVKRIGHTLGVKIVESFDHIVMEHNPIIRVDTRCVDLPLRVLPTRRQAQRRVEMAKQTLHDLEQKNAPYTQCRDAQVNVLGAEDILGYVILQEKGEPLSLHLDEMPAQIWWIRIGRIDFWGFPGEIFTEFGLRMKKKARYGRMMPAELANGCLPGYVYTKQALQEGGYEPDTSLLSEKAGDRLIEVADEMIEAYNKQGGGV